MLSKSKEVNISKYISYVLRHNPQDVGVQHLQVGGWLPVDKLLQGVKVKYMPDFSIEDLKTIVKQDSKGRYQLDLDQGLIRAVQGHSVKVDMEYQPKEPPKVLYHGTATRFLKAIQTEGLKPQSRQYVHLSSDIKTAEKVGLRHGKVIVLKINAEQMSKDGIKFYQADNGVWLCDFIDPKYIK